jgi:hypothetical protein
MKKTHKEIETREVVILDDVICNGCGKSIRTAPHRGWVSPHITDLDFVQIVKSWGFCSGKDMLTQHVDICEPCWDKFCETLAIPPTLTDHTGWTSEEEPLLSLFTEDELSGDPRLIDRAVCGFVPPTPGYAPCTREDGHDGPCAHPFS